MDIAGAFGVRLGINRLLPIGRWVAYMARGKFRHGDITKSPPLRGERILTPFIHYGIGIFLAAFYLAALGWLSLGAPTLLTAVGYGLLTSALPYIFMFPSMGYGFFGLTGHPRYFLLRQSLVNHFAFGVGLWLASLML